MIYPDSDKLEQWGSKYALVALAAKRAKQIKNGAPILVETQSRNPLTIALEEIAAGKITCVVSDADLPTRGPAEPEVSQLLAIPVEPDEDTEQLEVEALGDDVSDEEEAVAEAEETEEEEEEGAIEQDEIWKEVLQDESEEDVAVEPHVGVDADVEELAVPDERGEELPAKRGRKRKTTTGIDALSADLDSAQGLDETEAAEDESGEE